MGRAGRPENGLSLTSMVYRKIFRVAIHTTSRQYPEAAALYEGISAE